MLADHKGIIVRVLYPLSNKIIVFDEKLGKIECIVSKRERIHMLMQGALIEYSLVPWRSIYRMMFVEQCALPMAWVKDDILFMHQLLELIIFFAPFNSPLPSLFESYLFLYHAEYAPDDVIFFKKLFLCRFFALLGIVPEEELYFNALFFSLISGSIGSMLNAQSGDRLERIIHEWLYGCISTHPYAFQLKTVKYIMHGR